MILNYGFKRITKYQWIFQPIKKPRIKTKEILFLKTDFVKKHLKKTEILKREIEKSRTRKQRNKDQKKEISTPEKRSCDAF